MRQFMIDEHLYGLDLQVQLDSSPMTLETAVDNSVAARSNYSHLP